MGTGWRRAFCTRDPASTISDKQPGSPSPSPSPRSCARLGFLSGGSNPSTPRLRCTTTVETASQTVNESPRVQSKTTPRAAKSPKTHSVSNPTSPRSPLKLSLFKNSFKFRSSCGICLSSVKTGQGTAIYTAECGHAFHFPCIAAHVRKHGSLVCPVCNATWKDVPLLAPHKNLAPQSATQNDVAQRTLNASDKKPSENSSTNTHVEPPKHSDSLRSYHDDEPLLSPASAARIIPIPEADENAEDDDDDDEDAGETVQVKLMPENSGAPSQRAPIDLVTVLDVGGSMSGAKLHMLKRAMRLVISSLGPADRLSIVAFSASSKRLLPLRRMTAQGQRVARRIVDRLVIGQGSSVGDALRKATRVLEDRRERNPVASVMLLSDGQEERVQNQRGNNNNNQRKAEEAGGDEDAFAKCVGGVLSVVVQDLRIQDLRIQVELESETVEMSAIYSCSGRPTLMRFRRETKKIYVRLGDLYAEEERELLVELRVRVPASGSGSGSHHVMTVRCLYKDPASQEIVYGREQGLVVPPPQSVRCSGTRIQRLRNLFITSRAIAESRRLVDHNADFSSAHHLLASARALLMQNSSASAEEYIRGLEAELAELHWRRQHEQRRREVTLVDENGEPLTPTSAWRPAEKLAKMAMMKKSLNRVSDLHGFENARF
uniref:Inter-alpha-trypsin inhibitor heavy chain H4 n=1 Tax=Cajanus cajan TaxID=3821 RepID=A0A151SNV5_CAJCA|nr:Inter-alpha-trypsin inhibitor heavy chain H4 [Cajanus cajan]